MLWVVLSLMCLVAIVFTIRPLLGDLQRQGLLTGIAIVFVVAASAGIYGYTGAPDVPSGASNQPDADAMVASLAARLERQPDDLNGWKMLGRSQMSLGNFQGAVSAYERAVEMESAQNAQTLVDLGVALAQAGGQQLSPQAVSVFENAIALDPNHPEALFWSGIGAFNRGDASLAATRWEALLATNPPMEVRAILEQRIAAWRGEAPATGSSAATIVGSTVVGSTNVGCTVIDVAIGAAKTARSNRAGGDQRFGRRGNGIAGRGDGLCYCA